MWPAARRLNKLSPRAAAAEANIFTNNKIACAHWHRTYLYFSERNYFSRFCSNKFSFDLTLDRNFECSLVLSSAKKYGQTAIFRPFYAQVTRIKIGFFSRRRRSNKEQHIVKNFNIIILLKMDITVRVRCVFFFSVCHGFYARVRLESFFYVFL